MASIPLPALDIRPAPNPLDQYAKALSVKSLIGGQQLQQEQIKGAEQENQIRDLQIKDQQAMTAAMTQWDGKNWGELPDLILKNGGSANSVMGVRQKILEQQQAMSKIASDDAITGEKNLATYKGKADQIAGNLESLLSKDDKGNYAVSDDNLRTEARRTVNDLASNNLIDSSHAQQLESAIDSAPDAATLRQGIDHYAKAHMGASAMADIAQKQADTAAKEWKTFEGLGALVNLNTGEVRTVNGGTMTPAMLESKYVGIQQKIAQGGKATAEEAGFVKGYEKMKTLVPMFNFNLSGGANPLTPQALDQQAEKYYQTGQLPPVGRGPAGILLTRQIMQRASELHQGESLAEGSAEYKANSASLKALQSNLDQVTAFENTALKNLALFKTQAQKVIDTGIPLANQLLRQPLASLGINSTDQAALEASRQVAVNEIAKVTSSPGLSGQLSDSARHEIASFIPGSATYGQIMRLSDILTQDMANRHDSYAAQIDQIKSRLGGKSSTNGSPNTSAKPTPAGATHTGIGSVDKKKHWLDKDGNDLGVAE